MKNERIAGQVEEYVTLTPPVNALTNPGKDDRNIIIDAFPALVKPLEQVIPAAGVLGE